MRGFIAAVGVVLVTGVGVLGGWTARGGVEEARREKLLDTIEEQRAAMGTPSMGAASGAPSAPSREYGFYLMALATLQREMVTEQPRATIEAVLASDGWTPKDLVDLNELIAVSKAQSAIVKVAESDRRLDESKSGAAWRDSMLRLDTDRRLPLLQISSAFLEGKPAEALSTLRQAVAARAAAK